MRIDAELAIYDKTDEIKDHILKRDFRSLYEYTRKVTDEHYFKQFDSTRLQQRYNFYISQKYEDFSTFGNEVIERVHDEIIEWTTNETSYNCEYKQIKYKHFNKIYL